MPQIGRWLERHFWWLHNQKSDQNPRTCNQYTLFFYKQHFYKLLKTQKCKDLINIKKQNAYAQFSVLIFKQQHSALKIYRIYRESTVPTWPKCSSQGPTKSIRGNFENFWKLFFSIFCQVKWNNCPSVAWTRMSETKSFFILLLPHF